MTECSVKPSRPPGDAMGERQALVEELKRMMGG
jgi:hypothetical protein